MEVRIDYPRAPRPYQKQFHLSQKKIRVIVGGVGAGKTTTLCIEIATQLLAYPNNFGLLLRQDGKRLKLTTLVELMNYLPQELIAKKDDHNGLLTVVNGSQLAYMGLDDAKDQAQKIQSMNLGFVAIDQGEEVSGTTVDFVIKTRLRRPNSGRCAIIVANDDGRNWIYNKFIKDATKIDDKHFIGDNFETWLVTTFDNKENLPSDYIEELEKMPTWWKNRYIYSTMEDWSSSIYNILPSYKITPLSPKEVKQFDMIVVGIDYGKTNPSAAIFVGITKSPFKIVIFDEVYKRNLLISQFATLIKAKVAFWEITPIFVIDPRTDQSTGIGNGTTAYVDFINNGINAIPGDNDKFSGLLKVNELLAADKMRFCLNCENTIWEHENYKFKKLAPSRRETHNASEEPEDNNDHSCDATRYVVKYVFQIFGGKLPEDKKPDVASKQVNDYNPYRELFSDMDKYHKQLRKKRFISPKAWMA